MWLELLIDPYVILVFVVIVFAAVVIFGLKSNLEIENLKICKIDCGD
jgi:hypothetical protein